MARLFAACNNYCMKIAQWVPVVIVSVALIWGYYVFVYVMNISGKFPKHQSPYVSTFISVVLILLVHVILVLQLVSYLQTIFTKHKEIPDQFHLTDEQVERLEEMVDGQPLLREVVADLPVHTRLRNGGVRYCEKCKIIKPDRCHHCSVCNRCILKMDHHCPWVKNCVGYSNYKFFVLFLFYTMVLCLYFCLAGLYDFIRAWSNTLKEDRAAKFNVIACFLVSICFSLSTGPLSIFHLYLIMTNKCTLENLAHPITADGPSRKLFHLGIKRNLQQVLGRSCLWALLPVHTSEGDGASFPTRADREDIERNTVRYRGSRNRDPEPRTSELDQDRFTSEDDGEVEIVTVGKSTETQPLT